MLKFIWGKGNQPVNPERAKLQRELFAFQKTIHHGFPHKPTSLAWDHELKLMAIGTRKGGIRIYGRPGVEFYGNHATDSPVTKLLFLPGQARIVTLTDDNVLHLWEMNGTTLSEKKKVGLEGRLKRISCLELDSKKRILVGTEGGNIYMVNLRRFNFDEQIIYQDIVIASCNKEDFKLNPGAAESILIDPTNPDKILIGYERGLIVLWDRTTASADQSYVANQQLECLVWRNDGSEFISAHNDGSYIIWSKNKANEPPNMPYGPYPCKAITRFHWFHQNGTPWMIFSGGMPRASYGDKYTVSIMKGDNDKHVVFDLTSKIIDFIVIYSEEDPQSPVSLFILAEEELVAIDLTTPDFPVFKAPYLNSIHSSAVTCINQVSDISEEVYSRLLSDQGSEKGSKNEWPISGGNCSSTLHQKGRDILLTGHEDGSVKLWSAGGIALTLLAVLNTSKYFSIDDDGNDDGEISEKGEEDEEGWPPFRKVGSFDPYSDDPRMAIKKVAFCKTSGRVFIGGTAGQVVICDLVDEDSELTLKVLKADLVTEKEGFTWKGHSALTLKNNELKLSKGYQPTSIMQINPPASINSLGFHSSWGIMAVGTAHGLVFMDCVANVIISSKCTLNAQDIANADDNPMSRRKSLKKSLRESFRRLRKGRSQRNIDKKKIGGNEPVRRDLKVYRRKSSINLSNHYINLGFESNENCSHNVRVPRGQIDHDSVNSSSSSLFVDDMKCFLMKLSRSLSMPQPLLLQEDKMRISTSYQSRRRTSLVINTEYEKRRFVLDALPSIMDQITPRSKTNIKKEVFRQIQRTISLRNFNLSDGISKSNSIKPRTFGNTRFFDQSFSPKSSCPLRRSSTAESVSKNIKQVVEKLSPSNVLPCAASQEDIKRRELRRMWHQAYEGMCHRAVQLNRVIDRVDQDGLVRPVVHKDSSLPGIKSSSTKPFFSIGERKANISSDESLPLVNSCKHEQKRIFQTDMIILSSSNASSVRFNTRSHSIDVVSSFDTLSTFCSSLETPEEEFEINDSNLSSGCVDKIDQVNYLNFSRSESPESRPIERQVEARSGSDDGLGSMVRCLHFANTYIASAATLSPTLWAGTNSGQILIFMLTLPKNREGTKEKASTLLAKEIQLKHRAPVIDIQVLDSSGLPITDGSEESIPHRVLIASEEQFKIFLLPTLKPCGKYKLTAHEGSRIRRVGFTSFVSKSDESLKENCFVCLTNLGDIAVHSLPELKRQIQTSCIKKEDVIAISTLVFTSNGEAFYLSSSSEIQRVSVAAAKVMIPNGTVSLSSHARMEAPASPPLPPSTVNKSNENNGDAHNETTVSEVSADITLDSVKDHTVISQSMETSINEKDRGVEALAKQNIISPPLLSQVVVTNANNNTKSSELNGLESQVNGVLSENLDNSVVIEDHLSNQNEIQGKMEIATAGGGD